MSLNLDRSVTELQDDEQTAKRKNRWNAFLFYGAGAIGICLIIAGWMYHDHLTEESQDRMDLGETKVPATLEDKVQQLEYKNGKRTYRVWYKFKVNGRSYDGTTEMAHNPTTEKQTALYDPQDPTMNRLVGTADPKQFEPSESERWKSAATKGITVAMYFLVLGGIRKFTGEK